MLKIGFNSAPYLHWRVLHSLAFLRYKSQPLMFSASPHNLVSSIVVLQWVGLFCSLFPFACCYWEAAWLKGNDKSNSNNNKNSHSNSGSASSIRSMRSNPIAGMKPKAVWLRHGTPTRQEFRCAGAAFARCILRPNALKLSSYSNTADLLYIQEGLLILDQLPSFMALSINYYISFFFFFF